VPTDTDRGRSARFFRLLLESAIDGFVILDREGAILYEAPGSQRITGYPAEERLGRSAFELMHPDDVARIRERYEHAVRSPREPVSAEFRVKRRDGSWRILEARVVSLLDDPEVEGVLATFIDITERRSTERALEESEARYRGVVAALAEGVVLQLADGSIVAWNAAAEAILGLGPDEMRGCTSLDPRWGAIREDGSPFPPDAHPATTTLRTGRPCRDVLMGIRKPDGSVIWVSMNTQPLFRPGETAPSGVVSSFFDNTARLAAERARREADERLRLVVSRSPIVLFALDPNGVVTVSEGKGLEALGLAPGELVGRSTLELYADRPDAIAALRRALAGEAFQSEGTLNGRIFETHYVPMRGASGALECVLGMAVDVTERRRLEDELRHAQRLESIGRLAGGVAHDFNNLLTAIGGYAEFALRRARHDPRLAADLEEIRRATDRATALTRQLLAFSRKQILAPKVLDVNTVVREMAPLLGRMIGENIALETRLAPALGAVRADPGQLEQVIMNLVVNARDAMPSGGRLVIETGAAELCDDRATALSGASSGRYVMLAVADTGVGIAAGAREHLFEPFFTTKEGKGTGLGLATVYGIVRQSGGTIRVASEPGRGARFEVLLPLVEERPDAGGKPAHAPELPRGSETLLLVEDEDAVRTLAERILTGTCGYRVIEARSGDEALALAGHGPGAIDLLLTDVVMPGMSGFELAERLRARRPGLPVVYMSGYTGEAIAPGGVLPADVDLIEKPFTPETLARRVRAAIDRGAGR
jgi:two-component system cell cycle sensor histidine kinase/response regulator CckA